MRIAADAGNLEAQISCLRPLDCDAGSEESVSRMHGPLETEVKIHLSPHHNFPSLLLSQGFRELARRTFEANTLFDTPERRLHRDGMMLRLRQTDSKATLTWKGKGIDGPHKSRPETETQVESPGNLRQIFSQIGFIPAFHYEKFRTEFQREQGGVVTFDETPIGHFLELEGAAEWIDETALQLGFSPADYVLESYGALYRTDCERRGVPVTGMTFEADR